MRTAFVGTNEFAVAVLRRLAASEHRPELVVTRPERRRGRGRRPAPPPVAEAANQLGITVMQPDSINDATTQEGMRDLRPEAICVCAYGALIKEPLLSEYLMLNVHPSLLPRWRGAAPIERAIMAGDTQTGVSIIRLTEGLDSGPVCARAAEPVAAEDTYGSLAARLAELGAELLLGTLDAPPPCEPQNDSQATYAEKITPEDRVLDTTRAAQELERTVRALHPHIDAWIELPGANRLGVLEARVVASPPGGAAAGRPGEVVVVDGRSPAIVCGEGELELLVVKPAGRRTMTGAEWLRGWHA